MVNRGGWRAPRVCGRLLGLSLIALTAVACGSSDATSPNAGASVAGPASATVGTPSAGLATTPSPATAAPAATGSPTTSGAGSWCDALAVLRNPCQQCHGSQRMFGAPMSMVTYKDMIAPAVSDNTKKVYQLVRVRIHDAQKPMPPSGFAALTAPQLAALDSWIDAGALPGADPTCAGSGGTGAAGAGGMQTPAGGSTGAAGAGGSTMDPTTDPGNPNSAEWPADCEAHYTFLASGTGGTGKYSIPAGTEQHPSFNFPVPWTTEVQGVAYKPVVDNGKVLHHWILYGGDGAFLAGWAPGNTSGSVPSDVGIYLPNGAGASLRLDVHYNNLGGMQTETDASGVEFCVISDPSKMRPHTATTYGIIGDATAPAHQMVDNTTNCMVSASMGEVHLIGESPHMHRLGVHAKLLLTRSTGEQVVVHDMPFDFNEQRAYGITPDLVVNTGDQFAITCSYDNTTDTNVYFGQNTEDEMCFNFVMYWPKGGFTCGGGLGGGGPGGLFPH